MQVRLRVFAVLFASLCLTRGLVQAQTPGTGWVNITGSLQGPIYPCGNSTCPTYDSGQIAITVNGFSATTSYSKAGSQKTATQLANALAAKLNTAASPVTAIVAKSKITMTAKFPGALSNYPLSTSVTYNAQFAKASFTTTSSAPEAQSQLEHWYSRHRIIPVSARHRTTPEAISHIAVLFLMASLPTRMTLESRLRCPARPQVMFRTSASSNSCIRVGVGV